MGQVRHGLTGDLDVHVRELLEYTAFAFRYQPITDLERGKACGYEAVPCLGDETQGSLESLYERAIARECLGELGRSLRAQAIADCPEAPLFLGLHPVELDEGWLNRPDDPVYRHADPIYLQISESLPLSYGNPCLGTLRELRGKGVRICVADLGAGLSNLKYISDLYPSVVKLDRSLTERLSDDVTLQTLVRGIVRLCADLDARAVAVGVRSKLELETLLACGIRYAQGDLFGPPSMPPEAPRLP